MCDSVCYVGGGGATAEILEWTYALEAPALAPMLFPYLAQLTCVMIVSGSELIRLNGDGALVWRARQPALLTMLMTVVGLDDNGVVEILAALAGVTSEISTRLPV